MLRVINLSKTYPDGTEAVSRISFHFKENYAYSIIGPSGCGKSTFLLMVAGLLKPTEGEILIKGKRVTSPYSKAAVILQEFSLLPWKTVYENVALGLKIERKNRRYIDEIVTKTLKEMNLYEFKNFYPHQLSGGMRQKVVFGRVVTLNPEIVLLDEPLSSLDALNREKMQNFLLNFWKKHRTTSIIITHSIEEAVFLGDEILIFSNRPARVVKVIKNSTQRDEDYRNSTEFFRKCREVRESIEF